MLAAKLSEALRKVSGRKGSWPEKSFCLKQAEIQVGCHKLLQPSSYCRSPGLKIPPKSRNAPQAWSLHFLSALLLTSLAVVPSEAWRAPAGEPAGTIEAGGSVLTWLGEALIHI